MKTYKQFIEEAKVLWPGTPEYKKKYPETERMPALGRGAKHDIKQTASGVVASRRFDNTDKAEKPEVAADGQAPAKRGRGRPPGKYGTYKKKVKEAFEVLETLETDDEIDQFLSQLDEETINELTEALDEEVDLDEEQLDELKKSTVKSYQAGREKEATSMATRAMWDPAFRKTGPSKDQYPSLKKSPAVRDKNFVAAGRRLSGKIPTSK